MVVATRTTRRRQRDGGGGAGGGDASQRGNAGMSPARHNLKSTRVDSGKSVGVGDNGEGEVAPASSALTLKLLALYTAVQLAFTISVLFLDIVVSEIGIYLEEVVHFFFPYVMLSVLLACAYAHELRDGGTGGVLATRTNAWFLLLALFLTHGHGIHLASNSIAHYTDETTTPHHALVYWWDELFGHFVFYVGSLGFEVLLLAVDMQRSYAAVPLSGAQRTVLVTLGLLHGINLFMAVIEGQVVALGFATSALQLGALLRPRVVFGSGNGDSNGGQYGGVANTPYAIYSACTCTTSCVLALAWCYYHGSFVEFSALGIL